jgi:hypothetical protein
VRQVAPDGADGEGGRRAFRHRPGPIQATLSQAEANVARAIALPSASPRLTLVQRAADVQQAQANVDRDVAQLGELAARRRGAIASSSQTS